MINSPFHVWCVHICDTGLFQDGVCLWSYISLGQTRRTMREISDTSTHAFDTQMYSYFEICSLFSFGVCAYSLSWHSSFCIQRECQHRHYKLSHSCSHRQSLLQQAKLKFSTNKMDKSEERGATATKTTTTTTMPKTGT